MNFSRKTHSMETRFDAMSNERLLEVYRAALDDPEATLDDASIGAFLNGYAAAGAFNEELLYAQLRALAPEDKGAWVRAFDAGFETRRYLDAC